MIPAPGSPAARAGVDVAFMVCSEACRASLEASVGPDRVLSVVH